MIEGTEYSQMVMSAIYRTGQYFGANHIIDVVRGVESAKVKQKGHEKIQTFGVGRTASADFWKTFIRQLVSSKYLKINIQNERSKPMTDITFEKETDTLNFWFNEWHWIEFSCIKKIYTVF